MNTTIKATGAFTGATPTLTVSSGRGNTNEPEIHLSIRDDSDTHNAKAVFAWFSRDELLNAISKADKAVRLAIETGEPS